MVLCNYRNKVKAAYKQYQREVTMTKHINDRIAEHYSDIFSFVISRVDNLYIAEEITQNVMEKAIRKNSFIRKKESLKSWMMTIAANAVNDYYREVKRINAALLKEDEMFDASGEEIENIEDIKNDILNMIVSREAGRNIIEALESLEYKYRSVINLNAVCGFDFVEISRILNVNVNKVKTRYYRGLKKLKAAYMKLDEGGGSDESKQLR